MKAPACALEVEVSAADPDPSSAREARDPLVMVLIGVDPHKSTATVTAAPYKSELRSLIDHVGPSARY